MRALIEPDGFRNSSFTQTPSRSSSGVSPLAASTEETVPTRPGVPEVELIDLRALQPGVDLVRVVVDPLLGRVVRRHAVLADVARDQVLVGVGPGEVLDQLDRRGAGVGE